MSAAHQIETKQMEAATHRDILVSPCSEGSATRMAFMPVECAPANNKMRDALTRCALATLDTVPRFQTPFPEIPRRVAASAFAKDRSNRQAGCGRRDLGGGRPRGQGAAAKIGSHPRPRAR